MNKRREDLSANFDLLELLGLDLPLEEREIYYQEFLQVFLFNFLLDTIINQTEDESVRLLQRELNTKKSPDEIFMTIQELHPDFMIRFSQFVESQKRLFVISYLKGVIKNIERKMQKKSELKLTEKLDRYKLALAAAQAEDWIKIKEILNPQAQPVPIA